MVHGWSNLVKPAVENRLARSTRASKSNAGLQLQMRDSGRTENVQPLDLAGKAAHLTLVSVRTGSRASLGGGCNGAREHKAYVLALSHQRATGRLGPLSAFMTNPAGAGSVQRRHLVIASGTAGYETTQPPPKSVAADGTDAIPFFPSMAAQPYWLPKQGLTLIVPGRRRLRTSAFLASPTADNSVRARRRSGRRFGRRAWLRSRRRG